MVGSLMAINGQSIAFYISSERHLYQNSIPSRVLWGSVSLLTQREGELITHGYLQQIGGTWRLFQTFTQLILAGPVRFDGITAQRGMAAEPTLPGLHHYQNPDHISNASLLPPIFTGSGRSCLEVVLKFRSSMWQHIAAPKWSNIFYPYSMMMYPGPI